MCCNTTTTTSSDTSPDDTDGKDTSVVTETSSTILSLASMAIPDDIISTETAIAASSSTDSSDIVSDTNSITSSDTSSPESSASKTTLHKVKPMTRSEVLQTSDPKTLCLLIIEDKVYDCTKWQYHHPGTYLTIRALCGKDATDAFQYTHAKYVHSMLQSFYYTDLKLDDDESLTKSKYNDGMTIAFRKLTRQMENAGLFETKISFYVQKAIIYTCMFITILAGVLLSNNIWIHTLSGILLGLLWQQMAFIGHDLGHNSMTHNRIIDSYWGLFVGNFMTGVSMSWWKRSHNVHHIVTNSCDYDPDIQHLPMLAVDSTFLTQPIFSTYANHYLPVNKVSYFFVKYQHWLYYPIMAIARINLYVQSINHALCLSYYANTKDLVWRRELQILSLVGFWVWLITLTMQLPTWESRIAFIVPAHVVSGILHVQITLSHFAMPVHTGVTYDDSSNGYLRTQLRGSMDIDCPPYMDWFHGGIQFQVVHHIWPRLPRHNLRKVKYIFMEFCKQYNLEYKQVPFLEANAMVIAKLRETSKSSTKQQQFSDFFLDSINLNG